MSREGVLESNGKELKWQCYRKVHFVLQLLLINFKTKTVPLCLQIEKIAKTLRNVLSAL